MAGYILTEAAYWVDDQIQTLVNPLVADLPEDGCLWIIVQVGRFRQTLLGADVYWFLGDQWGMEYPQAHELYGGREYACWVAQDDTTVFQGSLPAPAGAKTILGVELSAEQWDNVRGEVGS